MFRNLWAHIRKDLPKRNVRQQDLTDQRRLPAALEAAIHSLYCQLRAVVRAVGGDGGRARRRDDAAGLHRRLQQHERLEARLRLDRRLGPTSRRRRRDRGSQGRAVAVLQRGRRTAPARTPQHDPGRQRAAWIGDEAMSADFKKVAAAEIERFKDEYRERFPGRDADELTDEDLCARS